jgi:hypothetical protein
MIKIFSARIQTDSHQQFQAWRQAHWSDGEFLHCAKQGGRKNFKLHAARCRHFENPALANGNSLTKVPKVCSSDRAELFEWAIAQGAYIQGCDCL